MPQYFGLIKAAPLDKLNPLMHTSATLKTLATINFERVFWSLCAISSQSVRFFPKYFEKLQL
jgi:hypothetical protein